MAVLEAQVAAINDCLHNVEDSSSQIRRLVALVKSPFFYVVYSCFNDSMQLWNHGKGAGGHECLEIVFFLDGSNLTADVCVLIINLCKTSFVDLIVWAGAGSILSRILSRHLTPSKCCRKKCLDPESNWGHGIGTTLSKIMGSAMALWVW